MSKAKYKLDTRRDVDADGNTGYILNLVWGWKFYNDDSHIRGYDTMQELRQAAKRDTMPCHCVECVQHTQENDYPDGTDAMEIKYC